MKECEDNRTAACITLCDTTTGQTSIMTVVVEMPIAKVIGAMAAAFGELDATQIEAKKVPSYVGHMIHILSSYEKKTPEELMEHSHEMRVEGPEKKQ